MKSTARTQQDDSVRRVCGESYLPLRYALRDAWGLYFVCDCCNKVWRVKGKVTQYEADWLPDQWELRDTDGGGLTVLCKKCAVAGCVEHDDR